MDLDMITFIIKRGLDSSKHRYYKNARTTMPLWQHLSNHISQQTQTDFKIRSHTPLGGGCINAAYKISNGSTAYFVKTNELRFGDMFETEALSLQELAKTKTLQTPKTICFGQTSTQSYLVLEYLDLSGRINSTLFGQQLAALHQTTANQFGWHRNNTIGATPQLNSPSNNWLEFWQHQRILPQLQLAEKKGYGQNISTSVEKLLSKLDCLFTHHTPQASLLHGDLWGGNAAALANGTPVIFDPAIYYGDRETDIAMTHLFGGFDHHFYTAYNEIWPLDDGFNVRKDFYNLYHILNHLNLFGSSYLNQVISLTEKVLAEI